MSKNIEIEAKVMISKKGYDALLLAYKDLEDKIYSQDNYYIDNKEFIISKNKLGLRIRKKSDDYIEFTVKEKLKEGKLEINQPISYREFEEFKQNGVLPNGEVLNFVKSKIDVPVSDLKCYALLVTKRLDINYKDGLISIDESTYNNITDYEVECESSSMEHAKELLKEFLKNKKIPYTWNHVSKLKRARESISKA